MASTFFLRSIETSTRGGDENILTHYYNNSYDQAKQAVTKICEEKGITILNVDDRYHEIYAEYDKGDIIFTLYPIGTKVSVDLKINYDPVLAFGKPYKLCSELYLEINKKLKLAKIGGSYAN